MHDYSKTKLFEKLINKTDSTVSVYEQGTGEIVTLKPSLEPLPEQPIVGELSKRAIVGYIVSKEEIELAGAINRSVDDLCTVISTDAGRDNIPVSRLLWAGEPGVQAILFYDSDGLVTKHL